MKAAAPFARCTAPADEERQAQEQDRWPEAIVQWQQVVRTERLDPTGWLSLARAQIHEGRKEPARRTLEHVLKTSWEGRFGDPKKTAASLLTGLDR